MNAANLQGNGTTVQVTYDLDLIKVDAALAVLSVIPAEKEVETAAAGVETSVAAESDAQQAADPGSVTEESFIGNLMTATKTKAKGAPKLPPVFADAQVFNDIIDCAWAAKDGAAEIADAQQSGLTNAVFDGLVKTAEGCVSAALTNADENLKTPVNVLLAAPHLLEQAHEAVQLEELGRFALLPSQAQISPTGANHPADATEFVSQDGAIECANFEVQGHLTEHAPIQHRRSAQQTTSCFVQNYTGPVPSEPCVGLPEFTVFLTASGYPTADHCSGEFPKVLSPGPYRLTDGHSVDLGGATCTEFGPAVTCVSNTSDGVSFTLSQAGLTVPITKSEKVKFAAGGLASLGQVRPKTISLSNDSTLSIGSIRYSAWNQQQATGTGTLYARSCTPTCAGGKETRTSIRFTLAAPTFTCAGFFFARITWVSAAGGGQPGSLKIAPHFSNPRQLQPCFAPSG